MSDDYVDEMVTSDGVGTATMASTRSGQTSLYKALLAVQAEMPTATINKVNPHFKSRYADLGAIREAVVPLLSKHGIVLIQATIPEKDGDIGDFLLETCLVHAETGEMINSWFPLPKDATPQQLGSAITYGRRYSIVALCGLTSEEDDDGEAANARGAAPNIRRVVPAKAPFAESVRYTALKNSLGETKNVRGWEEENRAAIADLPEVEKSLLRVSFNEKARSL